MASASLNPSTANFGGAVCRHSGTGEKAANRTDVDNVSAALSAHDGENRFCHIEKAKYIGLKLGQCFFRTAFFERASHAVTCVVDQDVESSETLERCVHGSFGVLAFCHIQCEGQQTFVRSKRLGYVVRSSAGSNHAIARLERSPCKRSA